MDGNQSLKLVDETFRHGSMRLDGRTARTDIWLSRSEVDRFKDEVAAAVRPFLSSHYMSHVLL